MCESKVFLKKDGNLEEIMENVVAVEPQGDGFLLRNLFGEEKRVQARLGEIQLVDHKIVLIAPNSS